MEEGDKEPDLSLTKEEPAPEFTEQNIEPAEYKSVGKDIMQNIRRPVNVLEWLAAMKWRTNPFIFNINPSLFVGYKAQTERVMMSLDEHHKFVLIVGPTGSGKTTLLRWLQARLNSDVLYIGKPPEKADEFVVIFNEKYPKPWYAFWSKSLTSIYQIPEFLNAKLRYRHLVILLDEAHEASTDVLEWMRVLNDQIENMSIVLSGLPVFEDQLRNNLETFVKRLTAKISLLSLTKEETKELIIRRIKNAGGNGSEFSDSTIDKIYEYTGGFPREVIRACDELVNNAMLKGKIQIEFDIGERKEEHMAETYHVTTPLLEKMTPMQKEVLELLSKKPSTPGQIADLIDLTKYKSRQHAVRSVNNIVKALHESGYLERRKEDKAYVYSLSPRISTLFVKR
jgi:type II secretory pathway predicted ATPase ExeA